MCIRFPADCVIVSTNNNGRQVRGSYRPDTWQDPGWRPAGITCSRACTTAEHRTGWITFYTGRGRWPTVDNKTNYYLSKSLDWSMKDWLIQLCWTKKFALIEIARVEQLQINSSTPLSAILSSIIFMPETILSSILSRIGKKIGTAIKEKMDSS